MSPPNKSNACRRCHDYHEDYEIRGMIGKGHVPNCLEHMQAYRVNSREPATRLFNSTIQGTEVYSSFYCLS